MDGQESLEKQIDSLQSQINALVKSNGVDFAVQLKWQAKFSALLSIALDLAKREGLSEEHFFLVFEQRTERFYQDSLESTEDVSSSLAVQTEKVIPSKVDLYEEYLSLFPTDEGGA